jgi:glycosyltransferase involved in cell wall biosynthesis
VRLAYLDADPGIPLLGHKGASIHVREMLRALASRVDSLVALAARVEGKRGRGVPRRALPDSVEVHALSEADQDGGPVDPELDALRVNDAAERALLTSNASAGLDAIYERYSLWSVAGARVAAALDVPLVLEVNAPLVEEAERYRSLRLKSLASFIGRSVFEAADRVLVVSEELRGYVTERGADPGRVHVLPNACADAFFHVGRTRPPAVDGDAVTLVFVGSLKPWHGLDVLLDAFLRLRAESDRYRLLVVGDGPMAAEVEGRLGDGTPPEAWRVTGSVPHDEVPELLAGADIAVAPYPPLDDFYFSPLKVVEYCAAGMPVVASRLGQIDTLLTDGESALLVEPGNAEALADAARRLAGDASLRSRLGEGARRAARGRTWDANADTILAHLAEAMSERRPLERTIQ